VIDGIVAHRGRREAKVLAVLGAVRQGAIEQLLPSVYDDVRAELLPIARYSLEAHLIKLEREGRAVREQGVWSPRGGAAASEARQPRDRGGGRSAHRAGAHRAGEQADEE
jgi:hypothetical protein